MSIYRKLIHRLNLFQPNDPFVYPCNKPIIHLYIPGKHQKTRGFLMFSGRTRTEHWFKLDQAITKGTNSATMTTFIATLAKANINIKEIVRPTACKTKGEDLQLVTLLRNEFLQRHISRTFAKEIFSLRKTSKWLFPRHYNNLKLTVRIILIPR